MYVMNVGFLNHFAIFRHSKFHKVYRNSWFSHRICVLAGSTTLPSLMHNQPFVVELWSRYCRKNAISSQAYLKWRILVQHVLLLRSSWNFTSRYALWREVDWLSFKTISSLLTELWHPKLSDMTSKFDDVISPSKMSALLWNCVDFLNLL